MPLTLTDAVEPAALAAWGWGCGAPRGGARGTEALRAALGFLAELARACRRAAETGEGARFDLAALPAGARAMTAEALGEGGVSWAADAATALRARETAFPGVWRLRVGPASRIEVGAAPAAVLARAHAPTTPAAPASAEPAARLASEIAAEATALAASWRPGDPAREIVLSRAGFGPSDAEHLDRALGLGAASAEAGGRSPCRAVATAAPRVWRLRRLNAQGALVHEVLEIAAAPTVAAASRAALAESAEELTELSETLR